MSILHAGKWTGGNRFVDLQFMKAGTADALVLAGISKQAFNSDVEVGAASSGGPPGYQSVPFHARMARMNHLFKLADENGVILGGAILFRQENYAGHKIVPWRLHTGLIKFHYGPVK